MVDWLAGWATKSVILAVGLGPTPSRLTAQIATSKSVLGDTGKLIGYCNANSANQKLNPMEVGTLAAILNCDVLHEKTC